MKAPFRPSWRAATLLVLAGGWALCVALGWPGHLSYDSVAQLADGRAGRFHTWHPPLMAALMGAADRIRPGAGLYTAAQAALGFGALALLVAPAPRPGPAMLVAAVLLVLSPLMLVWQLVAWKDVLFADALVAGFAALSAAPRLRPAPRALAVVASAVLLAGAALVRQSGAVAPLVAALAVAGEARAGGARTGRAALVAGGWLATCAGVAVLVGAALAARSVDDGLGAQLVQLRAYDLVGALARDPRLPLDRAPPRLAGELRRAAATGYTPRRNDALLADAPLSAALDAAPPGAVAAQWRELIERRPDLWLRHRAAVAREILSTPDLLACHSDFVGVGGDPEQLRSLGLTPRWTSRDGALARYAAAFHATPVYAHLFYLLLAAGEGGWLLLRRRPGDLAVAGLLLAAGLYAASYAAIGVACDYRYLYALDLAAMGGALHLAATLGRPGARAARR